MTRIYVFLFRSAPKFLLYKAETYSVEYVLVQYWLPATPFLSLFKSTRDAEPTVGVSKIKRHTIRSAGTVITEKRLAARAVAEFCFDCTHSNNASSSSATETVAHVPA